MNNVEDRGTNLGTKLIPHVSATKFSALDYGIEPILIRNQKLLFITFIVLFS